MLLSRIDGPYLWQDNPGGGLVSFTWPTDGPLPPGLSAYASIALSWYDTTLPAYTDGLAIWVKAVIDSWTVYNPDGTQSAPIPGRDIFTQNAAYIDNCATINFSLATQSARAIAQISVFVFG